MRCCIVGIASSIWVIHGLELVTALVVGCGLYAATVFAGLRAKPRLAITRIAVVVGATLAGAALVTVLTRLPHVPPPSRVQPSPVVVATASMPVKFHHILLMIAETDLTSPVALGLYVIGVIGLIIRRKLLWVLVAQALLVVMMVDDLFLHRFSWFWRLVYPWGDTDRILGNPVLAHSTRGELRSPLSRRRDAAAVSQRASVGSGIHRGGDRGRHRTAAASSTRKAVELCDQHGHDLPLPARSLQSPVPAASVAPDRGVGGDRRNRRLGDVCAPRRCSPPGP